MSVAKFTPGVYRAMKNEGYSNREIARLLGVNEASVRRGLKDFKPKQQQTSERRYLVTVTEVD